MVAEKGPESDACEGLRVLKRLRCCPARKNISPRADVSFAELIGEGAPKLGNAVPGEMELIESCRATVVGD